MSAVSKNKGFLVRKALEILSDASLGAADFFEAVLSAGYGASAGTIARELRRAERRREAGRAAFEKALRLRQRYYTLVSRLKKDGLIAEEKEEKRRRRGRFSITERGSKKLANLRRADVFGYPKPDGYAQEPNAQIVIVAFDVPERHRRRRDWLREVLQHLGLIMIQRSVWVGKVKIPQELLRDIRKMGIIECVEIFEVGKEGSLSRLSFGNESARSSPA